MTRRSFPAPTTSSSHCPGPRMAAGTRGAPHDQAPPPCPRRDGRSTRTSTPARPVVHRRRLLPDREGRLQGSGTTGHCPGGRRVSRRDRPSVLYAGMSWARDLLIVVGPSAPARVRGRQVKAMRVPAARDALCLRFRSGQGTVEGETPVPIEPMGAPRRALARVGPGTKRPAPDRRQAPCRAASLAKKTVYADRAAVVEIMTSSVHEARHLALVDPTPYQVSHSLVLSSDRLSRPIITVP